MFETFVALLIQIVGIIKSTAVGTLFTVFGATGCIASGEFKQAGHVIVTDTFQAVQERVEDGLGAYGTFAYHSLADSVRIEADRQVDYLSKQFSEKLKCSE